MAQEYSKVKTIAEDLGLSESQVASVLFDYLSWCIQEILVDKKCNTIFGQMQLDENDRLELVKSKFGIIDLIHKRDLRLIRDIIENGPDNKVFP